MTQTTTTTGDDTMHYDSHLNNLINLETMYILLR
jgi:hypothetical protein